MAAIFIGTAGWSIPRASAHCFPHEGTHLGRYARVLSCAEINSSFYRRHADATYARWAASTPASFRFAVKVPRVITHELRLRRARAPLQCFLQESAGLGTKRGPLLVQLPPSFAFDARVAARFFELLRENYGGLVACEPRHPTWFAREAETLLIRYRVSRVAADPEPARGARTPGGWDGLIYFRLHGSPRTYWSRYPAEFVKRMSTALRAARVADRADRADRADTWCVFDNTAAGAAIENALELASALTAAASG